MITQEYEQFKLFILDDNSPGDEAEKYIKNVNDSRITYEKNFKRLGIPGNFEKARKTGGSKWIIFLGQDDVLKPNFLSELNKIITANPELVLIQGKTEVIDEDGNLKNTIIDFVKRVIYNVLRIFSKSTQSANLVTNEKGFNAILVGNFFYFPTIAWNRDKVLDHKFRLDLEINLDFDLLLQILKLDGCFAISRKILAQYRRHGESASSKKLQMYRRLLEERDYFNDFLRNNSKSLSRIRILLIWLKLSNRLFCLYMTLQFLRSKDFAEAKNFMKLSVS